MFWLAGNSVQPGAYDRKLNPKGTGPRSCQNFQHTQLEQLHRNLRSKARDLLDVCHDSVVNGKPRIGVIAHEASYRCKRGKGLRKFIGCRH